MNEHSWTHSESKGDGTQKIMEGDQQIATLNPGASAATIRRQFKKIIQFHESCLAETRPEKKRKR